MNIKVMIIEDNETYRSGLTQLIDGTEGFECTESCSSCEMALPLIPSQKPDVILLDIGLPGMSGIEGIAYIKKYLPDTEILMLTIYEDDRNVFSALQQGASGYLLKKTPPAKILEAVEEIHSGGAPMSAKIARKVLEQYHKKEPTAGEAELTRRETEILELMMQGLSYRKIAEKLYISPHTVRTHLKNIYEKLHVHSKSEAAVKALKNRLI